MDMAAVNEQETHLCSNCKKDIPVANFTIHEIHCSRNIGVCHFCKESLPKSEIKNHIESEHVQVTCKCNMKMEKCHLEDHEASACPLRPAICQHCEIELAFNKLQDHEDYCGTRTETCNECGRNVMVKDLKEHPEVCGKEVEERRVSQAMSRYNYKDEAANLCTYQSIRNLLSSDSYAEPLQRMSEPLEGQFYSSFGGDQASKNINRRNASAMQRDQNQVKLFCDCLKEDELERLERNKNTESSLYGEQNSNLDYMLALSLQRENNPYNNIAAEIHSDFWKNFNSKESKPSEHLNEINKSDILSYDLSSINTSDQLKNDDIMLPCEFCEALYPEEDLILHQTGCNPASAFASFSKRGSSPSQQQEYNRHAKDFLDQLHSSRSTYPLQQQTVQTEGSIIIPCEFCGIQLEEEILFHHQDQCDLRPATASPGEGLASLQSLPPKDNLEKAELPEFRRRIRHQGEISPQYLEDFREQSLAHAVQGSQSLSNLAVARSVPLTSFSAARANDALTQKGKSSNLDGNDGRLRSRGTAESGTGPRPVVRSTQNFHPESCVPSLPRVSPTRPSVRNEAGRSPRTANVPVNFRNRSTKAKSQKPESGHLEEE
ncbi:TRAF-type zinc finger domain-containing protein 1 isoform X3 [Dermochelys coriacea]|uniref:TRAF-type zinc finger domain-containing protein 1 isoform X3 n=1 Tax=Dermochelys coriacea TaxID=27794 RepID=UPI0018E71664|nr:TRAF-type zinc finger domain-containing protein 1 isoform X3 [Dermochelys coriacea]XP_043354245.1 TRAF-type zinc finger domain-containing protein 1 isoform X3 [Dermochelys coriacea]